MGTGAGRGLLLHAHGQGNVKVFIGGIIPDEDVPRLLEIGVVGVYGPGTITDEIIHDIRRAVRGEAAGDISEEA